ncbi:MAG: sugar phosphate isomerase/epimerase family protein [Planctomycetota bacterium]|nr:sugar phosphate isomerase/epimerase family protein [Planctomycetota bacterium]
MSIPRLGVCSWSLQARDPQHLLEAVDRCGLDAVQLALSPLVAGPDRWGEAFRILDEAGINIFSGMMTTAGEDYSTLQSIAETGGIRPDGTWEENLAHAEAVADLAAAGGLDLVTFHAGFIPEQAGDPERAKLLERLRTLADLFARRGLWLGLETGQETAATLLEALEALDRPNVVVNFDPANMILYGKGDPVEALGLLAHHVMQVHIKDALPAKKPGTWGSEVAVGTGAIDWMCLFEIALAIDPPLHFIIEREAGEDRVADVIAARHVVERFLSPQ